jgi:molybdenum cofactor cytidylyltransferase
MTPYSDVVLEHFRRPRNRGALAHPSLAREAVNALCGDRVRMEARVEGDTIADVGFVGDACALGVAAASLLTGIARGRTLAACESMPDECVLEALGARIPAARLRCATLPLEALRAGARLLRAEYTTALLLAAGRGSRFGGRKLVAELDGAPVVRHAAERLLAARPAELIVVVGDDDDEVRLALAGLPVRFAEAPRAGELSSSLRAGLRALHGATRRILVALGDQPHLDPAVVAEVLGAPAAPIVVPSYRGVRGHPVRFDAALVPELLEAAGDRGARDLIARDGSRVSEIRIDAEPPIDVDVPGDLERLREAAVNGA